MVELLDSFSHHLKLLLGDGAYNDAALQNISNSIAHTDARSCQSQPGSKRSSTTQKQFSCLRLICETVNAQLQEQLHLSKHYAQSAVGICSPE